MAHEDDKRAAAEHGRPVRVTLPEPEPHLIVGLVLTAATAPAAKACVDLTRRLVHGPDAAAAAAGLDGAAVPAVALLPAGDLLADRGYSESVPANFHHPLRQLGFRLVFDLHKNRRGVTGTHRGAVEAFGNLYSPGLTNYPDLVSTNAPTPFAPWEEWQTGPEPPGTHTQQHPRRRRQHARPHPTRPSSSVLEGLVAHRGPGRSATSPPGGPGHTKGPVQVNWTEPCVGTPHDFCGHLLVAGGDLTNLRSRRCRTCISRTIQHLPGHLPPFARSSLDMSPLKQTLRTAA